MSGVTLKLGHGFPKFQPELSVQVRELQVLLKKWGYNIAETGHFDWPTDGAVLHFQTANALRADASVRVGGGKTWPVLESEPPATLPGASFAPDTAYLVPFISQYDSIHVPNWGDNACFAACEIMLKAVGVKQAGPGTRFQVISEETWLKDIPTQTINADALTKAMAYIDEQLNKSTPVMVGVSYAAGTSNEGITEHFVVIYEKEVGGTYRFHDPATNQRMRGAGRTFTKDANGNLGASSVAGATSVLGLKYYMSQVRKNEP